MFRIYSDYFYFDDSKDKHKFTLSTVCFLNTTGSVVDNSIRALGRNCIKKHSPEHYQLLYIIAKEKFKSMSPLEQQSFISAKKIDFRLYDIVNSIVTLALSVLGIILAINSSSKVHIALLVNTADDFVKAISAASNPLKLLIFPIAALLVTSAYAILKKEYRLQNELLANLEKEIHMTPQQSERASIC